MAKPAGSKSFNVGDFADFVHQFGEEIDDAITELGRMNLILFGMSGVGKSTLINAVCNRKVAKVGIGKPVTSKVTYHEHPDGYLGLWDTVGFELGDEGEEILADVSQIVRERQEGPIKDQIHAVWYCVRASDRRFEKHHERIVQRLSCLGLPVILVLTQVGKDVDGNIDPDAYALARYIESRKLRLAPDDRAILTNARVSFGGLVVHGLQELVEATFRVLPDVAHDAFVAAQRIDLPGKREAARRSEQLGIIAIGAAVVVPIPLGDAAAIVPIQVAMIARISAIYGLPIAKSRLAHIATSALLSQGVSYVAKSAVRSLLRFIPGVNIAVTALQVAVATSLTYAVAEAWIQLCEYLHDKDAEDVAAFVDSDEMRTMFLAAFKSNAANSPPRHLTGS